MERKISSLQSGEYAPLTDLQLDALYDITEYLCSTYMNCSSSSNNENRNPELFDENRRSAYCEQQHCEDGVIETVQQFFEWYANIEDDLDEENNIDAKRCCQLLTKQEQNSFVLLTEINGALGEMKKLTLSYTDVLAKTNSLNEISEQLLLEQTNLQQVNDALNNHLHYFTGLTQLSQMFALPALSVSTCSFFDMMDRIDICIDYITQHSNYKESYSYLMKYKQYLYNVITLIRNYVQQVFQTAGEQAVASVLSENVNKLQSAAATDVAFSLYYGKFQSTSTKIRPIIERIEKRIDNAEYKQLLDDCEQSYLNERMHLMNNAVLNTLVELVEMHHHQGGDNCALFRAGSTFMWHVCQDETQLYQHFFPTTTTTGALVIYLDQLCTHLYDSLRPLIVHINHMETLAELCGILRAEMTSVTEENSFVRVLWQLLQDVQERLVFRTNIYLQTDLLAYKPSAGDLAYPEKLHMMESIALAQSNDDQKSANNSAADLHGMWYPTVKRTLVCLSRLYRCVDRPIFQGLSQEALTMCVQSVETAAQLITARKTPIDGQLFQIKHLLILREQIAPFQVDFTVKEMCLDFSKMKTAAFGLFQKRGKLFSLSGNNALLEFLLEGTPQVKEQLVDSRKQVDKQLKYSCEQFIDYSTLLLIGSLNTFLNQFQDGLKMSEQQQQQYTAETIATVVNETQRNIKTRLPTIQRAMQLYLANKETEFILFRPIKNNVLSGFVQLGQLLTVGAGYTADDLLMIACPTAEQVAVLLSSASLVAATATKETSK